MYTPLILGSIGLGDGSPYVKGFPHGPLLKRWPGAGITHISRWSPEKGSQGNPIRPIRNYYWLSGLVRPYGSYYAAALANLDPSKENGFSSSFTADSSKNPRV